MAENESAPRDIQATRPFAEGQALKRAPLPTNIPPSAELVNLGDSRRQQAQLQHEEQRPSEKRATEQLSTGMLRRKSDPEPIDPKALEDALEYAGDVLRQAGNRVAIPEGMEGNPDFFIAFAEDLPLTLQDMRELGDNNFIPAVNIAIRQAAKLARDKAALRESQQTSRASLDKYLEERKKRETEDMTGLTTRGGFDRITFELAMSGGEVFTILIGDLNRLKAVNDAAGHDAGDAMIKQAADAYRAAIRDTDTAARYGGDELALTLLSTNLEEAQIIADRLMAELEKRIVPELGHGVSLGAGIVEINPKDFVGLTVEEAQAKLKDLIKQAEAAMYGAKAITKTEGMPLRGYMLATDPRAQERYHQMQNPPDASTIIEGDVR